MKNTLRGLSLLIAIIPSFIQTATAQNSRLAMNPTEIRVRNAAFVVERNSLVIAPDGNVNVSDTGRIFILREISATRYLKLPPANQHPHREIILVDKTEGANRWIVTGGFVTKLDLGLPPFQASDSVVIEKTHRITLFSDGVKWWDVGPSGGAGGGANLSPKVSAGPDITLPSTASQVQLTATVTPGTSTNYTIAWKLLKKPATATALTLSDTTQPSLLATQMAQGPYSFKVTVKDDLNLTASDTINVYITMPARMFSSGGYLDNIYVTHADPDSSSRTWVYLPEGYNPEDTVKYPLVMYLHGMGENGVNIDDLLKYSAGLPYQLYNNHFPMKSIVLMPQLYSKEFWLARDVKKAYDYALAGYKVDVDRVYATGVSSGASGVGDFVFIHGDLVAAYICAAPPYSVLEFNGVAARNIPGMFLSGYRDGASTPSTLGNIVEAILNASPQGAYPPLVKTVWEAGHNEYLWTNHMFDKRRASFDFEQDFLFLHHRDKEKTAANYVARAEKTNEFTHYAEAERIVGKLLFMTDVKVDLLARLSAQLMKLTTTAGHKYYIIDPGLSTFPEVANTNKFTSASANTVKSELKSVTGVTSTIDFTLVSVDQGEMLDSCPAHNYFGFDQSVYRDGLRVRGTGATMKLGSLTAGAAYDVRIYYSNKSRNNQDQTGLNAVVNGRGAESENDAFNTTKYIEVYNVVPNAQNEIIIQLTTRYGTYGIVNAIQLKEKSTAPPVVISKFDFSKTNISVPGWINVSGDPAAEVILVPDNSTGFMLSTVNKNYWGRDYRGIACDTCGMKTGDFSPEFPVEVVRSQMWSHNIKHNGSNYNLEIFKTTGAGLDAGTYQVKVLVSDRFIGFTTITEVYAKFGNGTAFAKEQTPEGNTRNVVTFTGYVEQGGRLKIGIHRATDNFGDMGYISALIVEKID